MTLKNKKLKPTLTVLIIVHYYIYTAGRQSEAFRRHGRRRGLFDLAIVHPSGIAFLTLTGGVGGLSISSSSISAGWLFGLGGLFARCGPGWFTFVGASGVCCGHLGSRGRFIRVASLFSFWEARFHGNDGAAGGGLDVPRCSRHLHRYYRRPVRLLMVSIAGARKLTYSSTLS